MSELADCTNNLTARDILRGVARTANGMPFYINTMGLAGDPCAEFINLVTNSGGMIDGVLCDTDWTDTNLDGVADDWTFASGAGACSIVTGNGFSGNAQRITHVNGTTTSFTYNTGPGVESADYKITMKYRASVTGWRIYIKGTTINFTLTLPINVGDAAEVTYTTNFGVGAANLVLNFYALSGATNRWLEIDEVILIQL